MTKKTRLEMEEAEIKEWLRSEAGRRLIAEIMPPKLDLTPTKEDLRSRCEDNGIECVIMDELGVAAKKTLLKTLEANYENLSFIKQPIKSYRVWKWLRRIRNATNQEAYLLKLSLVWLGDENYKEWLSKFDVFSLKNEVSLRGHPHDE